jgi:archaellum component FlaG (FlaF/FlaG flagellin family)
MSISTSPVRLSFTVWCLALVIVGLVAFPFVVQAMTFTRVTCATTATLAYTSPPRGGKVLIRNPSSVSVYIGGSAETTATGFEVATHDSLSLTVYPGDTVYCIVAAATQVVHVIDGPLVTP